MSAWFWAGLAYMVLATACGLWQLATGHPAVGAWLLVTSPVPLCAQAAVNVVAGDPA